MNMLRQSKLFYAKLTKNNPKFKLFKKFKYSHFIDILLHTVQSIHYSSPIASDDVKRNEYCSFYFTNFLDKNYNSFIKFILATWH